MIGIGIDLCEISRMEKILLEDGLFLKRYFTSAERDFIRKRENAAAQSMAAIFAAKEAFLKALSLGIGAGLALPDISVGHRANGQPYYILEGAAAERMASLGGTRAHLSLSHEGGMAVAVAVIE